MLYSYIASFTVRFLLSSLSLTEHRQNSRMKEKFIGGLFKIESFTNNISFYWVRRFFLKGPRVKKIFFPEHSTLLKF